MPDYIKLDLSGLCVFSLTASINSIHILTRIDVTHK